MMVETRPLASKLSMPFGLVPHTALPSASLPVDETKAHVPTSCSLSDFCWASALTESKPRPTTVIATTDKSRRLRRFMMCSLLQRYLGIIPGPQCPEMGAYSVNVLTRLPENLSVEGNAGHRTAHPMCHFLLYGCCAGGARAPDFILIAQPALLS